MKRVIVEENKQTSETRPAFTPEERENQLISLAFDRAEERLKNGTATSQEICHFLKLGSLREQKERELLEKQIELTEQKSQLMVSAQKGNEEYQEALDAMRRYSGNIDP